MKTKKLIYLIISLLFLVAIIFVLKLDTSTNVNISSILSATSKPASPSPTPSLTITEKNPVSNTPDRYNNLDNLKKESYEKILLTYKESFVRAVNEKDITLVDPFLVNGSEFENSVLERLNALITNQTTLKLKSSKLLKYDDDDDHIVIKIEEEVGIKEKNDKKFNYKKYTKKYVLEQNEIGFIILSEENL